MKIFYEIEYTVYNELVKSYLNTNTNRTITEMSLGDLHYSNLIPQEKLDAIVKYAKYRRPNHILISGDTWDSVDDIASEEDQDKIANFFKHMGEIAPVLIALGSHDWWKYLGDSGPNQEIGERRNPTEFLARLNDLNNVHVLDNSSYEDEDMFITGYTQGFKYYYPNGAYPKTLSHPNTESIEVMIQELTDLNSRIAVPQDKISEIIIHALATYGFDEKILNLLYPYLYRWGSHCHFGLVHPFYDERHPDTSSGIITPDRNRDAQNVRRTLRTKEDHNIICGPLTMFSKCSRLNVANIVYPMYSTLLNLTNNKAYDTDNIHTETHHVKVKIR